MTAPTKSDDNKDALPPRGTSHRRVVLLVTGALLAGGALLAAATGYRPDHRAPGAASGAIAAVSSAATLLRGGRDAALAMWGHTFERDLRDGSGPLCTASDGVAEHSSVRIKQREELGDYMENTLHYSGNAVEIGVQYGAFAAKMLSRWKSVGQYYLVDPWLQDRSQGVVDVDDTEHEKRMAAAVAATAPFTGKVTLIRNYSYNAVAQFDDCFFDFM